MGNIHYDPERILYGFTEDSLKDLAKKLKRRIRVIKSDIIQDILSPPKGKPTDRVKVWQEINRNLRKDLEAFSQEEIEVFSLSDTPIEEQLKVSYMFTLSSNPEIKAMGEKLYCQAQENRVQRNDEKELTPARDVIEPIVREVKKTYSEGLRTKGQLEKLKSELAAIRVQLLKEKEDNGKYRNRVQELEAERIGKDKEIEILKKKLEQLQHNNLPNLKVEYNGKIDLVTFQGRKALIFAEYDNDVDSRLNALGVIPIWAMEIDWNRPRRRMSTCHIVLYKMNSKRLQKLEEIRDIARYLNIPCNELLDA